MKQYVVIGCGKFGFSIAKTLYDLGNDVLAIDKNGEIVDEVADYVTNAVEADVTDEEVLRELGLSNFDVAIIGTSSNYQASIMATLLLNELGIEKIIAKAVDETHGRVLLKLGADKIIYPEEDMGIRVAHSLVTSNVLDFIRLSPEYSVVEISAPVKWDKKTLNELEIPKEYGVNVIAIKTADKINISPYGNDIITDGDILVILGKVEDIRKIERVTGD